jgi:hypothetical protein
MGMLFETLEAFCLDNEPRPYIKNATPSIAVLDQLEALSGALDMKEKSLSRLREEQAMLRDEDDFLRKAVDGLRHQPEMVAADMYA